MLPRFERYRRHVQLYNDKVFIRGISSTTSKDGLESFLKARVSVVPTDIAFGETSRTALVTFEGPVGKEQSFMCIWIKSFKHVLSVCCI